MTAAKRPDTFRVFAWGRRPLLAFPENLDRQMASAAFACYPAHTTKKRIVLALIRGLHAMRAAWLVSGKTGQPLASVSPEDWRSWVGSVDGVPVLIWPNDPRRGRAYVHILDASGGRKAFIKLAMDKDNARLIGNEYDALRAVAGCVGDDFCVPNVVSTGACGRLSYVSVTPLPEGLATLKANEEQALEKIMGQYRGEVSAVQPGEVTQLPWWQAFQRGAARYQEFAGQAAAALQHSGLLLCRVHGDLNETNVLGSGEKLWLLDWERSSARGPSRTDEICRQVDRRWPLIKRNPAAGAGDFRRSFWDGKPAEEQAGVAAALAYLVAADFTPAAIMVEHWGDAT